MTNITTPDINDELAEILKMLVADRYFPPHKTGQKLEAINAAKQAITQLRIQDRIDELEAVPQGVDGCFDYADAGYIKNRIKALKASETKP